MDKQRLRTRFWVNCFEQQAPDAQASRAAKRQGSCPSLVCFPEPSFAANEDGGGKQTAACFLVSPDGLLPLPAQSLSAGSNTGRPSDRHPPGRRRRRRGELWQLSLIPGRLRGAGPSARAIERDLRPLGRRAALLMTETFVDGRRNATGQETGLR